MQDQNHHCDLWEPGLVQHSRLSNVSQKAAGVGYLSREISFVKPQRICTLTATLPSSLSISPSRADRREDFPEPTSPTMATRAPSGIHTFSLQTHVDKYKVNTTARPRGNPEINVSKLNTKKSDKGLRCRKTYILSVGDSVLDQLKTPSTMDILFEAAGRREAARK